MAKKDDDEHQHQGAKDFLVYANISAPWSTFIRDSQHRGKSHSLSCTLENSLMVLSIAGKVATPLAELVLCCDNFIGIETGQLCEAVYFCARLASLFTCWFHSATSPIVTKFLRDMAEDAKLRLRLHESLLDVEKADAAGCTAHGVKMKIWAKNQAMEGKMAEAGWEFEKGTLTIINLSSPLLMRLMHEHSSVFA
ncbi:hypothetical protein D8B26_008284 [Coccidioides posadasii str. Silveira]|uniref:Predicted protein n=2 Tax=Coccidioides posadasii TaxID=199306 RepID=E9DGS0_COCPS|nr:predicted protein [Coccidioides posadasii str. Silveira]KMM69686.1 hypothetical protein CPAG_06000 [Coccidioides posadasii RMSCC 3488]QVM13678.1 hypothetical protein D8B26_008284 [Coccidioides posadasii str. Silveira]